MRRATDVQRLAVSLNAGARATPPIDATCDALSDDFSPESAEANADDSTAAFGNGYAAEIRAMAGSHRHVS